MPDFDGIRKWPSEVLAQQVMAWAASGEGQAIEFKEEMPQQASSLGKEIAALATSNNGVIVLGVTDAGEIRGLAELVSPEGRAGLVSRLEGITSNSVKPRVDLSVAFAEVDAVWCAVLYVEKGRMPVYYAGGIPYLRQLTSARPANPDEVIDLVLHWHEVRTGGAPGPEDEFLSRVAALLVEVLVNARMLADENRQVNPWVNGLRLAIGQAGDIARHLAARAPPSLVHINNQLEELAVEAEAVRTQHMTLNSGWDELREHLDKTYRLAVGMRRRWLEDRLSEAEGERLEAEAVAIARQTSSLRLRAEEFLSRPNGLIDLKGKSGDFGRQILRLAQFGVGFMNSVGRDELEKVAFHFLDVETEQVFMDGGKSARGIVYGFRGASERLASLLRKLCLVEQDFI